MSSICFSVWSGIIHKHFNQKEKSIHSSYARPKTESSDQQMGTANYMGASLEVNDKYYYIHCT